MNKRVVIALALTLFLFGSFNFVFFNFMGVPFSPVAITGHAVNDSGIVQIFIEATITIFIHSPEPIVYNFSKGEVYLIDLNVSADFSVTEWEYSLYDSRHGVFVESRTPFVPNSSITVVRWWNNLTVFAHKDDGNWYNESVDFFVSVPNSAPLIGNITDPILVCEGQFLDYEINATDADEDDLTWILNPTNPFYIRDQGRTIFDSYADIYSSPVLLLDKDDVGNHAETIYVRDPFNLVDSRDLTISVIEINNVPVMENTGAQTVWLTGEDSNFYRVINVEDVEDGVTSGGNLDFNLSWSGNEDLFDIGAADGVMNYTPILGEENRTYFLTVCVEDNALGSIHPNISFCFPNSAVSESVCDDFSLTVTANNRAPEIINHTPNESTLRVSGSSRSSFYVEVYDPDWTVPDIDWYVDDRLVKHTENFSNDSFSHVFGCGVSGAHRIEVVTTDGLLNDSEIWDVAVSGVECPEAPPKGGGISQIPYCIEDWVCDEWQVCQNVKRSFDVGILSLEDYSLAKDVCSQNSEEDERYCGFQITACHDLSNCGRDNPILAEPDEKRFCYFTENPNCFDGFTNCHDGACEILVDCGGPCDACATCSDGVQNQGEVGIDCGGPCPYVCEPEVPFALLSTVLIVLAILLVLVILYILYRLFLLWKRGDEDERSGHRDRFGFVE
jgi:hypothetical protein